LDSREEDLVTAELIKGDVTAKEIKGELKREIEELNANGITPGLATVLVGEDPASKVYVRMKHRACAELGIQSENINLPGNISQEELLDTVSRLNEDERFSGILVQLPLPSHVDESEVLKRVDPMKDVDCFHPFNLGLLYLGVPVFQPCTPSGVVELLVRYGHEPEGKHAVIVGRSNIVGKPLAVMLMQKAKGANATVTVCHSRTKSLTEHCARADILIVAIGKPRLITGDMVKEGAVVIDVGVNRVDDPTAKRGYRLVGDVDFDDLLDKVQAITPVPGGVGPMTIAMLMRNTVKAARLGKKQ
jgi:methylenetetrahydrofolate dehydrogenase (NADP+)/methenyltetrahydrofolate cyclohydrolase